jgi:PAS domain S-box-containing protein
MSDVLLFSRLDRQMQCPRCQVSSPEGKRFCGDCGAPLSGALASLQALEIPTDIAGARDAVLRAVAEQRQAEEEYRKIFEGSVDGIYVTTPEGRILNANPALARMMGYDSPQHLIDGISDIAQSIYVDPTAREEYLLRMRRDGMVREFEYQVRQRGGDILWLSDSATAVRDESGRVIRHEGAVRDITDQRRAEQALAASRRQLQTVIDSVPAVINVKDTNFRYLLMNRYMARIFDVDPDEAVGRTTNEIMARYGASKETSGDRRVLETGEELGFYEEAYFDSAHRLRHWMANKVPVQNANGEIEYIVTVALDITDRKRGEQETQRARDSAENALSNLRATQNSLIESEKLAALGRLVAGVAHEVNNPVGIGVTVATALQRRCHIFADELARGALKRSSLNAFVQANLDAAGQLVANLNRAAELILSFKQVAVDRNMPDRRQFNLADLTEQIVTSLRPGLRSRNLTLTVDCAPHIDMNSYPGPYGQVVTNLFLNSVVHAFPASTAGELSITAREAGDEFVEIVYSDNGVGMTDEVRRHAFDPFFTTRRDKGGTGLGLNIVHNIIINRLGGRIDLTSEVGKGTRFHIVLPRVAPLERAAE